MPGIDRRGPFALDYMVVAEGVGLGKLIASGFNSKPTWVDPNATDWADVVAENYGWVQFLYIPGDIQIYAGAGASAEFGFTVGGGLVINGPTGSGYVNMLASDFPGTGPSYYAKANVGQTSPLLELGDENGNDVLALGQDGSVGGVTPNDGDQLTWDAASGSIMWKGPLV